MLSLLFNTLLTITPHNRQKRRRRKERTMYGPLGRYSPLDTHPVRNPRQGLTWAPELKLNFICAMKTSCIPGNLNFLGETAFLGGIFCLGYPSRCSEKVNCHIFVNYRLSFRKLQILILPTTDCHFAIYRFSFRKLHIFISQTTDSHFANYRFSFRFIPFHFVSLHFVSQTTVSRFWLG